jgi:hypothetical protein
MWMLLGAPVAVIFVLLFAVPISLYYAWAASILWGWFLVPFGLPPLTILQIWGICLFLSMLRPRIKTDQQNKDEIGSALMALALSPLISLALGYAIKFWWMA